MERHFGLPVAFAAAAHAALLFGFSKSPRVAPAVEPTVVREWRLATPPPVEDVEQEIADSKTSAPLERPDISPVRQPEPPALDVPTTFTQPKPPPTSFDPNSIARVIPTDLAGTRGDIGTRIGDVVPKDFLDNPPRTRYQSAPPYPFEAKKDGRHGEVIVEFIVDESGHVQNPRVVSSSDRVFEENTLRAVAKWVFEPGRRDGKIVRFRMSVPVVFKLNE